MVRLVGVTSLSAQFFRLITHAMDRDKTTLATLGLHYCRGPAPHANHFSHGLIGHFRSKTSPSTTYAGCHSLGLGRNGPLWVSVGTHSLRWSV